MTPIRWPRRAALRALLAAIPGPRVPGAVLWGAALAGPAAVLPARAATVSRADARQVRQVIEAQLAALAADDAERAFSYATAALRRQFGSAEHFIAMVRGAYPVVYRPASVSFMQPEADGAAILQGVQMADAGGTLWLASYRLERQRDRHWRIAGCVLSPSAALST